MSAGYIRIANLIFLLALFPYVSPFKTPFDTQPWALLAVIVLFIPVFLLKKDISFPAPLFWLLIVTVYAGGIYLVYLIAGESDPLGGARSLAGYLTVFLLAFVGYKTFRQVSVKPYILAVWIWLLGGVLQLIYGPEIMEHLVPRLATGGYRGLTSFAPEPAYYAIVCAALMALNEIFYRDGRYGGRLYLITLVILIIQIVLSYSGVGLTVLFLFLLAKGLCVLLPGESIREKTRHVFIVGLLLVCLSLFVLHPVLSESRAGYLFSEIMTDPISLLQKDNSVSLRLGNVPFVLYGGLIETYGLGFGLATQERERVPELVELWLGRDRPWGGRTMGGLLSTVYEIGVVGLILVLTILWIILHSIFDNSHMRPALISSALVFLLPRFIFDSIAFPLLGYLVGIYVFYQIEAKGKSVKI